MTDRERLIELIRKAKKNTKGASCDLEREMLFADFLLANGVIVPPCKVGQTVYVINSLFVSEYLIKEIAYDDIFFRFYCENNEYAIEHRHFMFFDERIGKTVFLPREEAEKALSELNKGE